ncbi:rod shape-determining protein RodA [Puteibacter caeruleilacunae]|nr:rod shape-determining protein RodA [Puteibacter caeruleilacunae]
MAKRNNVWANLDWLTIFLWLVMVLLGWTSIYAAVYNEEHSSILDMSQQYGKQLLWIIAAIVIGFFMLVVDSKFYVAFSYPVYAVTSLLLLAVLFLGTEINGARSWFDLGVVRLQPSEFAKFATALALAKYTSKHNFKVHRLNSLLTMGAILGIPMLLIVLQGDAGSALVYAVFTLVLFREGLSGVVLFFGFLVGLVFILTLLLGTGEVLAIVSIGAFLAYYFLGAGKKIILKPFLYVAGSFAMLLGVDNLFTLGLGWEYALLITSVISGLIIFVLSLKKRWKNVTTIMMVFLGSVMFTYSVNYAFENILQQHQRSRINLLLGKISDPLGVGWHVKQSMTAIGSGGVTGKGFLQGTQTKFKFVPEQSTDFIFCTVGEEWGFIGTTALICLFLFFLIRLVFLAERQRSVFSRVYGYSVACILFFHFAINIGMTIKLAPVIGIPLPFFSYGGSSLWSFTILLFIFLRLDASRLERL